MTTLTLDAALRQQALTQLGIAQDSERLAQIQQVAESQAADYLTRYQTLQHANGFAAYRGRQHFKAQLSALLPLLPETQQLVIQQICH